MRISSILSKYYIQTLLTWLVIFLFGVAFLIVLFDFSETMRRASSKPHITIDIVLKMVFLQLPFLLQKLLPFVTLFSTMFSLWKLNKSNEIIASRAAGISIWQLLLPMLATVFMIGLLNLTIFERVSANFMARYKSLNAEYFHGHKGGISISDSGIWLRESGDDKASIFRIGHLEKNILHSVTILTFNQQNKLEQRTDAKTAVFNNDGLVLNGVWISPVDGKPTFHNQISYPTNFRESHLQNKHRPPETLSFWDLPKYIKLLEQSGLSSVRYNLYWHSLIANILLLMGMVLLAATCSLRPIRQGRTILLIVVGTTIGFLFYVLQDITFALGYSSTLPTGLAAWAPASLTVIIGLSVLLQLEDG